MRRILVAAVAAMLSSGVALGPAGAASAAKAVVDDGTSDVFAQTYDVDASGTDPWVYTPAGSLPNVDVIRTTVKHTATAVRFTVEYADLVTSSEASDNGVAYLRPGYDAWVATGDDTGALLSIWEDTPGDTETFLWRPGTAHPKKTCDGVTGTIDFEKNTLTGRVPRSCLDDPSWVRFHGNALADDPNQAGDPYQTLYQDNANSDGYTPDALINSSDCFTQCEGWTKKIRHG